MSDESDRTAYGVVKADPRTRRRAMVLVLCAMAAGLALIVWGLPRYKNYVEGLDWQAALNTIRYTLAALFLLVLPGGAYLFHLGGRVMKAGQYPPPGMKVFRDTAITTGSAARRRAVSILVLAALMMGLGLCGAGYVFWVFPRLILR